MTPPHRQQPPRAGDPGNQAAGKQAAAHAAAALVTPGMQVGLGTGSTVALFLDALAERGVAFDGLPTSQATAAHARRLGFSLVEPDNVDRLDLAIDGADELDHGLQLTKGGGGALLREKVVAALAERFVVIATADKMVDRLGDSFPLPIEVVPFAIGPVSRHLARLGFTVTAREGGAYRTDNGNAVLFARLAGGLDEPAEWDIRLGMIPGVVTTGLFINMADTALLGDEGGSVATVTRPSN
ncbi:MAG: ribose-5-phosphate isomerase RpiA [Nitriliruptoraceae bacterium]